MSLANIVITAESSAVTVFNNILLPCIVDPCILEVNRFCGQPFGSIGDSGELGNESVHRLTFLSFSFTIPASS